MKNIRNILLIGTFLILGGALYSCNRSEKMSSSPVSSSNQEENSDSNFSPFSPQTLSVLQGVGDLASEKEGMLKQLLGDSYKSWSMGPVAIDTYEFSLTVNKVEPQSQAGFDDVKEKALPFLNLLLKKLKDLGMKDPQIKLVISVSGLNVYKTGITNEYLVK